MQKFDKIIDAFREFVVLMVSNMLPLLMFIKLNLDTTNCTYFSILKKRPCLSFHYVALTLHSQFLLGYNQDTC